MGVALCGGSANLPDDLKVSPAAVVHPYATTVVTPTIALSA